MLATVTLGSDGLPVLSGSIGASRTSLHSSCKAVSSGTTIVACCYSGGIVLGADTRTSSGSYVVNRAARKITKLSDRVYVCRSGSAADTQALAQIARVQLQMHVQELPREFGGEPPVGVAAHLLQKLCFEYKDQLTAGLIVGGWDRLRGPQVYSIPIGGSCIPVEYTAGGSGSVFITAFLDDNYKRDMSKLEAEELVARAVSYAISRDGSSGGMIRLITIDESGVVESCIEGDKLPINP